MTKAEQPQSPAHPLQRAAEKPTGMASADNFSPAIAIVGVGPRGISVLERLAARIDSDTPPLTVHLIDDAQVGAGSVWDTDQTRTLCMNTRAGAVTLFTEPGCTVTAPILEGPILYEWIQLIRGEHEGIAPQKVALYRSHPVKPAVAESYRDEIARTRPESNPTRALYGEYLRWVFEVVKERLPHTVRLVEHKARVTALKANTDNTRDILTLSDGTTVAAEATVLAAGWQTPALNGEEEQFAQSGLRWIRPANPIEQDYHSIPAGEDVVVRGLGMGFFDIMALTTIDRGGRFVVDESARGGMRYEKSGREPHFIVASGRGFPFFPKSEYGQLPPEMPLRRLKAVIAQFAATNEDIDFETQVFPTIIRDAYEAYVTTLFRVRPQQVFQPLAVIIQAIDAAAPEELPGVISTMTAEPWDIFAVMSPLATFDSTAEELTRFIAQELEIQIKQALEGADSPVKAALWSISESRKPSSILGAGGRYTPQSRVGRYAQLMGFGQMVGSGPPLFRTQELLALIDASLVTFLGPHPTVAVEEDHWRMTSGRRTAAARTLVDAWMHQPDIRRPADPLVVSLLEQDRMRPFEDHGSPTGSPEVHPVSRRLITAGGAEDARVLLIGIPTYAQMPDTTISPMPGTNPLMLQETDKAATALLSTVFPGSSAKG